MCKCTDGKKVAVSGAKIKCPKTEIPNLTSVVNGTTDVEATGCAFSILTDGDAKVGEGADDNIRPFKCGCLLTPAIHPPYLPCQPVLTGEPFGYKSLWGGTANAADCNVRVLVEGSHFVCVNGGQKIKVEIKNSNQDSLWAGMMNEDIVLALLLNSFDIFSSNIVLPNGTVIESDFITKEKLSMIYTKGIEPYSSAAKYLYDHSDLFDFLDTGKQNRDYLDKVEEGDFYTSQVGRTIFGEKDKRDGQISQEDVQHFLQKRIAFNVIQEVHAEIDVAAKGGKTDGVLSREDYEVFARRESTTDLQKLVIAKVLQDGAVDGEQGVAEDIGNYAATTAKYAGYASLGLAIIAVGAPSLAAYATVATGVGIAASLTQAGAGVFGDNQDIVDGIGGAVVGRPSAHPVQGVALSLASDISEDLYAEEAIVLPDNLINLPCPICGE